MQGVPSRPEEELFGPRKPLYMPGRQLKEPQTGCALGLGTYVCVE
ncbi:hypothetical protein C5167_047908 [Papaver somniferum]|uniref:Uncharacterized protein n=1 Tax=Papaver somniferum TaxID=3469 RepID=A0A4Y7KGC0_PAPSO|nr:hypothetical protein C5167_047908 [Papaver somniferum]